MLISPHSHTIHWPSYIRSRKKHILKICRSKKAVLTTGGPFSPGGLLGAPNWYRLPKRNPRGFLTRVTHVALAVTWTTRVSHVVSPVAAVWPGDPFVWQLLIHTKSPERNRRGEFGYQLMSRGFCARFLSSYRKFRWISNTTKKPTENTKRWADDDQGKKTLWRLRNKVLKAIKRQSCKKTSTKLCVCEEK